MILDPLFYGYEALASLIPFIAVLFLLQKRHTNEKFSARTLGTLLLFALYVVAVFYVTGAGTFYDGIRGITDATINLIPFSLGFDPQECLLNVVMLVPLGFMLPLIWKNMSCIQTVGVGFLFSLLIETSQLLNFRASDVNDLILNTLGALLGYVIYRAGQALIGSIGRQYNTNAAPTHSGSITSFSAASDSASSGSSSDSAPFKEALIGILALFAGNFFLYNPLILVPLLYGPF